VPRPQPGETAVEIDADHGIIGSAAEGEADFPASIRRPNIRTVAWHPYFDHLTHDQRLRVLRARGGS
jgi:hypothetical protein